MCKHKYSTLVQSLSEFGWFSAYQCDMCGDLTRQTVPLELYEDKTLPNIDLIAFETAIRCKTTKIIDEDWNAMYATVFAEAKV